MPAVNLDRAVSRAAERLSIDLARPLDAASAERLRTELSEGGLDVSLDEIHRARAQVAEAAAGRTEEAGARTRGDREASRGAAPTHGGSSQLSAVAALRAGSAPAFDAQKALASAYRAEIQAAGLLQWRPAESGISMTTFRWIPDDEVLAAMPQRSLQALVGSVVDDDVHAIAYWPKDPKPGDTVYLQRPSVFGAPEYASLTLQAPRQAPAATAPPAGQGARALLDDALGRAGVPAGVANVLKGSTLKRDDTLLVYLTPDALAAHGKGLSDAFVAMGMKRVTHEEYGVPTSFYQHDSGALFGIRRDEVGGAAGGV